MSIIILQKDDALNALISNNMNLDMAMSELINFSFWQFSFNSFVWLNCCFIGIDFYETIIWKIVIRLSKPQAVKVQ